MKSNTWNGWPEESSGLHEVILCTRERRILRIVGAVLFLFLLGLATGAWIIFQAHDRAMPRDFVGRAYPGFPSPSGTPHFSGGVRK